MKIAVMQPYLFPYIGYFQLMNSVDKFIILDDVNFIKKGWINRNRILLDGKGYLFSMPLQKMSQNKLICDTEIANPGSWRGQILRTIECCYKRAPYYRQTLELMNEIMSFDSINVSEYNLNSLRLLADAIGIDTKIIDTSRKYKNRELKGQDRIIDICKLENATSYFNLSGGITLYDRDMFSQNDIDLKFIRSKDIIYRQLSDAFVPNLSIIDVLMFNDRAEVGDYLGQYELI